MIKQINKMHKFSLQTSSLNQFKVKIISFIVLLGANDFAKAFIDFVPNLFFDKFTQFNPFDSVVNERNKENKVETNSNEQIS
jgi:hypothetical protein